MAKPPGERSFLRASTSFFYSHFPSHASLPHKQASMDSSSRGSSSSHRRDLDKKADRDNDRDKDRKHRHHDRHRNDDADSDRHKKHKSSSSSKSRHHDRDDDRDDNDKHSRRSHHKTSSSRHDRDRERGSRSHREDKEDVDMAEDDEDMWVEKEVSAPVSSASAPTVSVASKPEKSNTRDNENAEVDEEADKGPKRDSWMTDAGGMDFGLMGALKVKKPKEEKPNPDKVHTDSFPILAGITYSMSYCCVLKRLLT